MLKNGYIRLSMHRLAKANQ